MAVIRSWREAYIMDRCPRCGATLDAPDDNLNRSCPNCGITVEAATVEILDGNMTPTEASDLIDNYCGRTFPPDASPPQIVKARQLAERAHCVTPEIRTLCDPYRAPFILP